MPYTPGNNSISATITVSGDVTGSIGNTKVVSVENVQEGILSVPNGGTGVPYNIPGSLLVGNASGSISNLTGVEGDFLRFISGSWINNKESLLKNVNLVSQNNNLFFLESTENDGTKNFNLVFNAPGPGLFFATNISASATDLPIFRPISAEDLPDIFNNITINNSVFSGSGNFTGIMSGTHIGSFSGDGSEINNIKINNISGLEQSIINSINSVVNSSSDFYIKSLNAENISSTNVNILDGKINGTLSGDGKQIYNLQAESIVGLNPIIVNNISSSLEQAGIYNLQAVINNSVTTNLTSSGFGNINESISDSLYNIISGTDKVSDILDEKINNIITSSGVLEIDIPEEKQFVSSETIIANVSGNTVSYSLPQYITSSAIFTNYIVSSEIYSKLTGEVFGTADLRGLFEGVFIGDGSNIGNLKSNNLDLNYININNNRINLGQSILLPGVNNITNSDNNIDIFINDNEAQINLSNNLSADSIYSDTIISDTVNSNLVSASFFIGDGSQLTNVDIKNISDIESKIINLINVDQSTIVVSDGALSLAKDISLERVTASNGLIFDITSSKGYIQNLITDQISLNNINSNNIACSALTVSETLSSSYFIGDGSNLKNIPYSSLTDVPSLSDYGFATSFNLESVEANLDNKISYILKTTGYNGIPYINNNLVIGNLVCLSGSDIVKAQNNIKNLSLPIGMVTHVSGSEIIVQDRGHAYINLINYDLGEKVFLSSNGGICKYSDLVPGQYAVQIGHVHRENILILDIKKLWKIN